jgi:hypothetical protein
MTAADHAPSADTWRATSVDHGPRPWSVADVATPITQGAPGDGVRLVVGGVELELPAGCRAKVVIGADGRPTISLLGLDTGP